jgi:hypothetical protein
MWSSAGPFVGSRAAASKPTTAARSWLWERVFMPLKRPWWRTRSRSSSRTRCFKVQGGGPWKLPGHHRRREPPPCLPRSSAASSGTPGWARAQTTGNITDRHAGLHRLSNHGNFQIARETSPTGDTSDHLNLRERVGHRHMPRLIPRLSGFMPVSGQNGVQFMRLETHQA